MSTRQAALPEQADVIVVGGGIVGASIAYHLTKRGVSDVVVLERHQLTAGTTWHAAGLVAQLRATENQTKLARYSHTLYQKLKDETEQDTGFRDPGAISVASTPQRWEELRRVAAMARYHGVGAQEISVGEIAERWPLCETADLLGGVWVPGEAVVGPSDTTLALAKGARMGGAKVFEGVDVGGLLIEDGRCVGVEASRSAAGGPSAADGSAQSPTTQITANRAVVLACGLWTRHLAATVGVDVPLMAAEHHYVVTEPIDGISIDLPVLRDPDRWAYLKPEAGGSMLVGLFEPVGRPWPAEGPPPTDKPFITMDPDPDHLANWLEPAFDRIPALHQAGIRLLFDGPESFTPDDAYILGETPQVDRLFVAAGFNSIGIQSAGGAGMATAHWITEGRPPFDLHDVDIRRFERWQNEESYLRERTVEVLGLLYADHWPHRTFETARSVVRTPLHDRLAEAGAWFADLNGWDRPMYFARPDIGVEAKTEYSWGKAHWHEANAIEHRAVRETVGLFDLTSFAKFEVTGPDAGRLLDRLSAGAVNADAGRSIYTQWCNDDGGIEADLTVSRLHTAEADARTRTGTETGAHFRVIGGAGTRTRDRTTLEHSIKIWELDATVHDSTQELAVLAIMGPAARDVLSSICDDDLSDEGFPFATNRDITIRVDGEGDGTGHVTVWANRMSYVGELGWELYVAWDEAVDAFDAIREAGAGHGMELCGYHALNSLRFEKGYRHWGHDITPDDTPIEAGLGFAVGWDKPTDFVGRAALEKQREEGATQRLVQIALDQPDDERSQLLHHNEPVYRNGERVGYVTGGMWGHTVGAAIGMAVAHRTDDDGKPVKVTPDWVNEAMWEVELPGGMVPARVQLRPLLGGS